MVYRHNEWARSFVQRVSRGMKQRKKIAIVALARKLLVMLWAMLRDGTHWRSVEEKNDRCAGGGGFSPPEDTMGLAPLSSVEILMGRLAKTQRS
jgi:hypothetical protein